MKIEMPEDDNRFRFKHLWDAITTKVIVPDHYGLIVDAHTPSYKEIRRSELMKLAKKITINYHWSYDTVLGSLEFFDNYVLNAKKVYVEVKYLEELFREILNLALGAMVHPTDVISYLQRENNNPNGCKK